MVLDCCPPERSLFNWRDQKRSSPSTLLDTYHGDIDGSLYLARASSAPSNEYPALTVFTDNVRARPDRAFSPYANILPGFLHTVDLIPRSACSRAGSYHLLDLVHTDRRLLLRYGLALARAARITLKIPPHCPPSALAAVLSRATTLFAALHLDDSCRIDICDFLTHPDTDNSDQETTSIFFSPLAFRTGNANPNWLKALIRYFPDNWDARFSSGVSHHSNNDLDLCVTADLPPMDWVACQYAGVDITQWHSLQPILTPPFIGRWAPVSQGYRP